MISHPNVKINLGLHVLGLREDGFHNLESLLVPHFGLSDTLEIIEGGDASLTSAHLQEIYAGPGGDDSLAQAISPDGKVMITIARRGGVDWEPLKDLSARAYMLLDAHFNLPPVKIYLEKTSPVGAGLGGGSADAAFALRMLSEMFSLNLDENSLAHFASELGSDCAFFIYNRPMFARGRGDELSPYNIDGVLANYQIKVVVPEGISVSTAEAYKGVKMRRRGTGESLEAALSRPVGQWKECLENDFEPSVFAANPELARIKQSLYNSGAIYAAMSGSGSALFALMP